MTVFMFHISSYDVLNQSIAIKKIKMWVEKYTCICLMFYLYGDFTLWLRVVCTWKVCWKFSLSFTELNIIKNILWKCLANGCTTLFRSFCSLCHSWLQIILILCKALPKLSGTLLQANKDKDDPVHIQWVQYSGRDIISFRLCRVCLCCCTLWQLNVTQRDIQKKILIPFHYQLFLLVSKCIVFTNRLWA